MGFKIIGFPPSCHPNYGALTSTPAGLAPAEHTSLHWTHIDTQNLRHFLLELGVATLQIVAHLVRLDFLLAENLAHRALDQLGKALVPRRRAVLARMACQQPRRPQLMRITVLPGLV